MIVSCSNDVYTSSYVEVSDSPRLVIDNELGVDLVAVVDNEFAVHLRTA